MVGEETKSKPSQPRLYEYELPGGWIVLAGRSDAGNEYLSLRLARPLDWWFHVRGMPGSHVILRAKPDKDPDRDTLKQAAAIAAYHSKARGAGIVPVSYTLARNVTKPLGSKTGSVEIRRESVLKVPPSLPIHKNRGREPRPEGRGDSPR
ncbi:MAG: NFACT RNA binding domain-containing protein [Desulfobacteraceae bacterium]|jgi:predicted ribosome quality control (RQC) complex YloA/Tae2 family protein